jgi:uncharacterized protein YodC (DUF2158 family)
MAKAKSETPWEAFKKQFPKGAKVQLNTGSGPVMAVKGYLFEDTFSNTESEIVCQWFSGKKLESGHFAPETLVVVKDDAEKHLS